MGLQKTDKKEKHLKRKKKIQKTTILTISVGVHRNDDWSLESKMIEKKKKWKMKRK